MQVKRKIPNPTGKGGFVKGDPRINKTGRPRAFDHLRDLAQRVCEGVAKNPDGTDLIIDGKPVTVCERILREWAEDDKHRDAQGRLIEVAYGKVPNPVEISGKDGKEEVVLKVIYVDGKNK